MDREYEYNLPIIRVVPENLKEIEDTIKKCYEDRSISQQIIISWKNKKNKNAKTYENVSELLKDTIKPNKVTNIRWTIHAKEIFKESISLWSSEYGTILTVDGEERWAMIANENMKSLLEKYKINVVYRTISRFKDFGYISLFLSVVGFIGIIGLRSYPTIRGEYSFYWYF